MSPQRSRAPGHAIPPPLLVMGVAGSGKTLVGSALAVALGARFVEGDRHHPPENIARMKSGLPLRDEDRWGWLDSIAGEVAQAHADGEAAVIGCSALKRVYRDRLRRTSPDLRLVFLDIDRDTAARRVGARKGHFMPASLVDSQFEALEPPGDDEHAIVLAASGRPAELVERAIATLAGTARPARPAEP